MIEKVVTDKYKKGEIKNIDPEKKVEEKNFFYEFCV